MSTKYDEYEFRPAIVVDGLPVPEIGLHGIRDFKWGTVPGRRDEPTERRADLHPDGVSFVQEILNLAEEYDRLMLSVKWTIGDVARVKHIEDHFNANEVVCRCGVEWPQA